jgi:kynurenine formamidase
VLSLVVALALIGCQPASSPDEASPAFPSGTVVDLTYAFNDSSVYWPTAAQEFTLTPEFEGTTDAGYYYSAYAFSAFEAHQILFEDGIAGFENLANLDQLPPQGFHVLALPMKIEGGSGGPARIIAILPESDDA